MVRESFGRDRWWKRFRSGLIVPVAASALAITLIALLVGGIVNHDIIVDGFNGKLVDRIRAKQLTELKAETQELSPGLQFVDLTSARKLFDEKEAVFLDSREEDQYVAGHIKGALSAPLVAVLLGEVDLDELLPDREAILVTYCDGGECATSVDLARELVGTGYVNVFTLGEGYPGWKAAEYPVEGGDR